MENNEVKKEDKSSEHHAEHTEHHVEHHEHHPEHHSEHNPEHHPSPAGAQASASYSPKKKANWKTILFAVIALILLIIIILMLTNVINLKGTAKTTTKELSNISYELYSDNILIDSGDSLFEKNSVSNTLGLASSKLDDEINKMQVGEEKNITLQPKDAFGEYDSSLKFTYPRVNKQNRSNQINRTAWILISAFTSTFNEQPVINETYNLSTMPWPCKVLDANATHVKISQEATLNQQIPYGMFNLEVTSVTDKIITLTIQGEDTIVPTANGDYMINFTSTQIITTIMANAGQELELTDPKTGLTLPKARVASLNDTDFVMDSNNEYAGNIITAKVKLINKKTEQVITGSSIKHIEGAPTMQVFIMSHCPYGTQIVKGLLPVWQKFQNKANIEVRFVSYTMHGAKEDLDNNRIICLREEQSSKLLAYLDCFVYGDGSETSSQACIASTGIDKTKLESCIDSRAAGYMEVDKALNEEFGVQGSPTVILDGKEASVYPRDPASVAKALCAAFTSKPSECSSTFDTTNPSPGFGGGSASSSGSGASCG